MGPKTSGQLNNQLTLSLRAELSNNLILLPSSNMQVRFGHQRLSKHNSHTFLKGNSKYGILNTHVVDIEQATCSFLSLDTRID